VAVIDLERRVAVVRAGDDGGDAFPHALRGTLAAMLAEPTWHVVVAFEAEGPARPEVARVIDQAREWARQARCRLSVTSYGDVARHAVSVDAVSVDAVSVDAEAAGETP
jgi:hypothetical protein